MNDDGYDEPTKGGSDADGDAFPPPAGDPTPPMEPDLEAPSARVSTEDSVDSFAPDEPEPPVADFPRTEAGFSNEALPAPPSFPAHAAPSADPDFPNARPENSDGLAKSGTTTAGLAHTGSATGGPQGSGDAAFPPIGANAGHGAGPMGTGSTGGPGDPRETPASSPFDGLPPARADYPPSNPDFPTDEFPRVAPAGYPPVASEAPSDTTRPAEEMFAPASDPAIAGPLAEAPLPYADPEGVTTAGPAHLRPPTSGDAGSSGPPADQAAAAIEGDTPSSAVVGDTSAAASALPTGPADSHPTQPPDATRDASARVDVESASPASPSPQPTAAQAESDAAPLSPAAAPPQPAAPEATAQARSAPQPAAPQPPAPEATSATAFADWSQEPSVPFETTTPASTADAGGSQGHLDDDWPALGLEADQRPAPVDPWADSDEPADFTRPAPVDPFAHTDEAVADPIAAFAAPSQNLDFPGEAPSPGDPIPGGEVAKGKPPPVGPMSAAKGSNPLSDPWIDGLNENDATGPLHAAPKRRPRWVIPVAVLGTVALVLGLFGLFGGGSDEPSTDGDQGADDDGPPETAPSADPADGQAMLDRFGPSVLTVTAPTCSGPTVGAGVVLTDGRILTTRTVAMSSAPVVIDGLEGVTAATPETATDQFTLLVPDGAVTGSVSMGGSDAPAAGATLIALMPDESGVTPLPVEVLDSGGGQLVIDQTAPSGAPIFDGDGALVGMVLGRDADDAVVAATEPGLTEAATASDGTPGELECEGDPPPEAGSQIPILAASGAFLSPPDGVPASAWPGTDEFGDDSLAEGDDGIVDPIVAACTESAAECDRLFAATRLDSAYQDIALDCGGRGEAFLSCAAGYGEDLLPPEAPHAEGNCLIFRRDNSGLHFNIDCNRPHDAEIISVNPLDAEVSSDEALEAVTAQVSPCDARVDGLHHVMALPQADGISNSVLCLEITPGIGTPEAGAGQSPEAPAVSGDPTTPSTTSATPGSSAPSDPSAETEAPTDVSTGRASLSPPDGVSASAWPGSDEFGDDSLTEGDDGIIDPIVVACRETASECDRLFAATRLGSAYQDIALDCGGRGEAFISCAAGFGEALLPAQVPHAAGNCLVFRRDNSALHFDIDCSRPHDAEIISVTPLAAAVNSDAALDAVSAAAADCDAQVEGLHHVLAVPQPDNTGNSVLCLELTPGIGTPDPG